MIINIKDNKFIFFQNTSVYEEELLDKTLSVASKKNNFVVPNTRSLWDGVYRYYHRGFKRAPRPMLGMVLNMLNSRNIPYDIIDSRPEENKEKIIDASSIDEDFLQGIKLMDYQIEAIKKGINSEVGIFDIPTGGGKCLGKDTPVMMFDGSIKAVQDIKVGELLMGDDSSPRKVLSVCSGRDKLYRIDQIYGDSYIVNRSHILSLTKTPCRKNQRHQKVDISIDEYLNSTNTTKHRLKGYKVPIDYNNRNVVLDPYFLGLWLGDGISADTSFCLHERDSAEAIDALYKYAESLGCVIHVYNEPSEANNYAIRLYEGIHAPADYVAQSENPFRKGLKHYNLLGNKHIPDDYIYNSRNVRLQLLAGLIDSDGELKHKGYFINLKNKQIIEKCCIIARSLGLRANIFPNRKKSQTGYEGQYWKLSISGNTDMIPTKISYKKACARIINKNPLVSGIKVTDIGYGDYYGFEIDGNKRFLLGDFTVTHNTEVITALCKAISVPTIILADQIIIVRQIKERLALRDITDVGMFYAGKRPNGQTLVVGSPASLVLPSQPKEPAESEYTKEQYAKKMATYEKAMEAWKSRKKNTKILQEYVKRSDMIIIDECDKASSDTYKYIFKYLYNGRRRYGFSGTPIDPDKPVEEYRMKSHLGNIIYKQDRRRLEELNRIIPFTYRMMVMDGSIRDARAYDIALNDFVFNNLALHNMIAGLCIKHKNSGSEKNGIMILVDRDVLGENLKTVLSARGINTEFIHGKTSKSKNKEVIESFEKRDLDVLIGGKIASRGLDLKGGCEYLIDLTSGKLTSEFIQRVGRAVRVNKIGKSVVYGMFYRCNKYLYGHSKKRMNIVIDMGYPVEVYHKNGMISGEDLKNRNYNFNFKK